MSGFEVGSLVYENPLAAKKDVKGFRLEGEAKVSFPNGRMRMENVRDRSEGQKANFVHWCPEGFPADVSISWDFYPVREPGLCILFFAAKGINGEDALDPKLAKRTGEYKQYHHGDINALHVSYFRRTWPEERSFHTCNLRKSYGFHLVAQGADPIPTVEDALPPYRIRVVKCGGDVVFFINDLEIFHWIDDGKSYGPVLGGGKIGFRQMAPLAAEYANLKVHSVSRSKSRNPGHGRGATQISAGWRSAVHSYFDLCPESPDGKRAVYYEYSPGSPPMGQVVVATLDGRGQAVRHDPIGEPILGSTHGAVQQQWIDNDTLAYRVREGDEVDTVIWSLRDGSSRRIPGAIRMFSPASGKGLACSMGKRSGEQAVFLMDIDRSDTRRLFTKEDMFELHPWRDSFNDLDNVYLKHSKWSPDGKRFFVVFTNEGYRRPEGVGLVKSIFVADADGSNLRYLTEFGHHPMWSPDSSFAYAFEYKSAGLLDLVAHPVDGREPYPILADMRGWHASLSPDGKTVVTDVGRWEKAGQAAILLYDLESGSHRVLAKISLPEMSRETRIHPHPVWSRDGKRAYFNSADTGIAGVWAVDV